MQDCFDYKPGRLAQLQCCSLSLCPYEPHCLLKHWNITRKTHLY